MEKKNENNENTVIESFRDVQTSRSFTFFSAPKALTTFLQTSCIVKWAVFETKPLDELHASNYKIILGRSFMSTSN